ncbi:type I DNA topoisomerase [Patescibacteria group bacterium]|nr:type I DNA topoisomerase [Patescibacteria group bacterium]MBU1891094.1 type I DNA topoisomerase [Patescibacteria group bacterium]
MAKNLVIVESPTKAKTISRFLGRDFIIRSSNGHIRDLPKSKIGVDTDKDFEPVYEIPSKSKKTVTELKKEASKVDQVYYATDEDREGEAIAWHLASILKTPVKDSKRITFHEITKEAILEALKHPRGIDINKVDSQQARRILDRLVGYKLSPFLWKKIARGLSAGRVQSVVVRLLVEQEEEIKKFKVDEYWEINGSFKGKAKESFNARLLKIDGKSLKKMEIKTEERANELQKILADQAYHIGNITKRKTLRNPSPPFITSTLQQEANRRLYFSSKQTMMLAQRLYEGIKINGESTGLITYMRTDSLTLSQKFTSESADFIKNNYSQEYLESRVYKTKSKSAQEAHEAIRPTSVHRTPEELKDALDERQYKLYKLIWQRALASQMSAAQLEATSADINTKDDKYTFRATGQIIKFDGFLKVYPTSTKDEILPSLDKDEQLTCLEIKTTQKFTQPPPRFSDASLVKVLEEKGIGRPSTYAPTIATVVDRGYAERIENRRLKPTDVAFIVNDLLVKHFSDIVDYSFTAKMEENLDEIAEGKQSWQNTIKTFYDPFNKNLMTKEKELDKKELTETDTDEVCEKCGKPMVIKVGRFGKFLACTGYPDCKTTKQIDSDGKPETETEVIDEKCPECGKPLQKKVGRYGPFFGCSGYPDCKYIKNIEKSTGVKCPKCNKGEIIERRSRRGKTFYSCNQYPKCENALWSKPNGEKCPECDSLLVYAKKGVLGCSNKECKFSKEDSS